METCAVDTFNSAACVSSLTELPAAMIDNVSYSLVAILLSAVAAQLVSALRYKLRIAKAIANIPGPKGWPLIGVLPTMVKHGHRYYDFHVRPLRGPQFFSATEARVSSQTQLWLTLFFLSPCECTRMR